MCAPLPSAGRLAALFPHGKSTRQPGRPGGASGPGRQIVNDAARQLGFSVPAAFPVVPQHWGDFGFQILDLRDDQDAHAAGCRWTSPALIHKRPASTRSLGF